MNEAVALGLAVGRVSWAAVATWWCGTEPNKTSFPFSVLRGVPGDYVAVEYQLELL